MAEEQLLTRTEFEFTLPKGYVDETGALHREGRMRLATAGDELLPLADIRVQRNPAYLFVVLLARVIVKLGSLSDVTPKVVEGFFVEDLSYCHGLYNRINGRSGGEVDAKCPVCGHAFAVEGGPPGE